MHADEENFNFDQCKNCNFVFLNPRVPEEELHRYYTSYYLPYRGSKAWGKYKSIVEKSQQKQDLKKLKRITEAKEIDENSLILDVGCGQPSFLKKCQERLGCRTMGIDFSDKGWADDEKKYEDIDLLVGEISDLPEQLHPDVISMWHYLEHDYTPIENLSYLKSLSKPETKLVIEIPNFDSSSRRKYGKHWAGWHTPRHTSLFSPNNVELCLNKSGWKVDKILTYGTMDAYVLHWMSKMEKKNIKWDKNMEDEFFDFTIGMLKFLPQKIKEKKLSLGIMTIIASPQSI